MSREQRLLGSEKYLSGARFNASDALRMMAASRGPKITVSMARTVLQRMCDSGKIVRLIEDDKVTWVRAKPVVTCVPWKPPVITEDHTPRWY